MAAGRSLHQFSSHSPSSQSDTYIYSIVPCLSTSGLALIDSADELLILDRTTLRNQGGSLPGVPTGVTCLTKVDDEGNAIAACGRDGSIGIWDLRSGEKVSRYVTEQSRPVTALACSRSTDIAGGTELVQSQAVISVWDIRTSKCRWQSVESHNDDITELQFHPTVPDRLLSGSTDGLVSIFDTTIQDEDEALIQVINHGSIHRAGFLADDAIYALSHDEQFSIHALNTAEEAAVEPLPIVFGDVREKLACEYVVDVMVSEQGPLIATGFHSSDPRVDLIPIGSNPSWSLQVDRKVQLVGGHGDEIVRSVFVDNESQSVYTAGEDGMIKIWRMTN